MSTWLDRWARGAAATSAPPSPRPTAPGHSTTPLPSASAADPARRTFLKRAALVTGMAWSVPVMQTALAPAASASVACHPVCIPGQTCETNSDCGSRQCVGFICIKSSPPSGLCVNDVDCTSDACGESGTCVAGRFGDQVCAVDEDCYSGTCTSGRCTPGANGTYCVNGSRDCVTGICAPDGFGGGVCATAYYGGGTCSGNSDCTTDRCDNGTDLCRQSRAGQPCAVNGDCTTHLCSPATSTCVKSAAGGPCSRNGDCTTNSCNTTTDICNQAQYNRTCSANSDCYSGHCVNNRCGRSGFGVVCTGNNQCTSRNCSGGTCQKGAPGRECWVGSDCASGTCSGTGTTLGTCA